MNIIDWLAEWYQKYCDGDWEHCYGIKIQTLDNPGWMINIDLTDTDLEEKVFETVRRDEGDEDWLICNVKDKVFQGNGSLNKFEDIILVFKEWVEKNSLT